MNIVAITGHRPNKIKDLAQAEKALADAFDVMEPDKIIQGMAAGIDLLAAKVAYRMDIPFIAARPWAGHKPRVADKYDYMMAMNLAAEVVNVDTSEKYHGPWVYHKRNEWMVDNANLVFAYWDGTDGGTAHCVKYANQQERHIYCFDPNAGYSDWIFNDEPI